ncbi:MAG TPA: hypothetical protein VMR86_19145 [Myxococcota bacterium]|nr:hypothetical protein [Myxococcota bacterium]
MEPRSFVLAVGAAAALSCSAMQPKPYASDSEFKSYIAGLGLAGVTAQAATARLEGEGFACNTSDKVIAGAPQEIVFLCRRTASEVGCSQTQTVVMQLDWVGTPRVELAPGMRIKSLGNVLDKTCK